MINYGVVVGRFQVNDLHEGHLELLRQVSEKHERVIVFIGVTRTISTKRNPLDFETRKKMIQAEYPDFIILPLRDEKNDAVWSSNLDRHIADVTQFTSNVTLYGGGDSFIPHYHGAHKVVQLAMVGWLKESESVRRSGTEVRRKLANKVISSPDFRAGAIYAAANRFPLCLPTVDIAILHNEGKTLSEEMDMEIYDIEIKRGMKFKLNEDDANVDAKAGDIVKVTSAKMGYSGDIEVRVSNGKYSWRVETSKLEVIS